MVEWVARMVTPAVDLVAPVFRRTVDLDHGTVTSAVLHVSSLGVHECFIDGVPVSPEVLSPGWSAYEWRLRYRSHDVTPLLRGTGRCSRSRSATAGGAAGSASSVAGRCTATGSA